MDNEQVVEASPEELQEAGSMGWADKDKWRGKPEDWVDAKTFLEKGRQVLPIVRASNDRLKGQLDAEAQARRELEGRLAASEATLAALEEAHEADTAAQVEAARAELKTQLAEASREGDHEAVADLTQKMTDLAGKAPEKKEDKKPVMQQQKAPPEIIQWYKDNPEFINDPRSVALGNVISQELRQKGVTIVGPAFLDMVAAEVEKERGKPQSRRAAGKVEGGNGGAGGRSDDGGGGKTYADLPADAKAACDKAANRLVGANRAHKDVASWRASYVKQYYQG